MTSIKLISASNVESPVDLTGFKTHIGFSIADTSKDDHFTSLLKAATDEAQCFTGRQFMPAVFEQRLPDFKDVVELEYSPVTGINSVKYFDGNDTEQIMVSGTDYYVDVAAEPAEVHFINTPTVYEYRRDAVIVNFGAGYISAEAVPFAIKAAIKLYAANLYVNPADPVRNLPTASRSLLRNYRLFNDTV